MCSNNISTAPTIITHAKILECPPLQKLPAHNKLDGRLPTELGALGSVDEIDLRNNLLDASLPTQMRNLPELTKLYLSSNSFVGSLDSVLCNRPESYLPWATLESDCLTDFVSCSCCTSCCNGKGGCCTPGSEQCNQF